jgi:hypothetical protein
MLGRLHIRCLAFALYLVGSVGASASPQNTPRPESTEASKTQVLLSRLPLEFEPASHRPDSFLTRSGSVLIGLSTTRMDFQVGIGGGSHLAITFDHANSAANVSATERTAAESNYLVGNDASSWRTHVPHYDRLTYANVYSGVNLTLYGNGQHLEHDFIVKPGADWTRIQLGYEGARSLSLDRKGNLHVHMEGSEVVMRAPFTAGVGSDRADMSSAEGNKSVFPSTALIEVPHSSSIQSSISRPTLPTSPSTSMASRPIPPATPTSLERHFRQPSL